MGDPLMLLTGEDALLAAERFGRDVVMSECMITTPIRARELVRQCPEGDRAMMLAGIRVRMGKPGAKAA